MPQSAIVLSAVRAALLRDRRLAQRRTGFAEGDPGDRLAHGSAVADIVARTIAGQAPQLYRGGA
jgi:hypothetical protein